mmetsp:Transcript_15654/g.24035  ORF Transcript_15654/g.24035 Transcript_15654/m.24035 type:complete len:1098 (-) Transcript_15654:51-3344(-)
MAMDCEESLENHDPNGENDKQLFTPRKSKLELIRKIATAKIDEEDSSDEEDGYLSRTSTLAEKNKSSKTCMDEKLKGILNKYGAMPGPNMPLLERRLDKKKDVQTTPSRINKTPTKSRKKEISLENKTRKAVDKTQKKECQELEIDCPALPTRFLGKEVYGAVIGKGFELRKEAPITKEDPNVTALKAPQSFRKSSLTKKGFTTARDSRRYGQKPIYKSKSDEPSTTVSDKSTSKSMDLKMNSEIDQRSKCNKEEKPLCPKLLQTQVDSILSGGCSISTDEIEAAIKIQSAERAYSAVRLLFTNKSVLKIQTLWRGFHCQSSYEKCRQNALKIQSHWRMYHARRNFLGGKAVVKIQAAWRCIFAKRKFLHYQTKTQASIVIQAAWRSFFDHCNYMITLHATFSIQALVRGHLARKICRILLERRQKRRLLRDSATAIQKQIRGCLGRAKYRQIRQRELDNEVATRIQTTWRCYHEQRKFASTMTSLVKVQSFARASIQQVRFLSILYYVVTIQTTLRRFLAKKKFVKSLKVYKANRAATQIQATWRAKISRDFYHLHCGARIIQKTWRMFLKRRDFSLFRKARDIQTAWRRYSARMKYINTLISIKAATKIQTACRTFLYQTDYLFTLMDIMTIQRVARGAMGRTIARQKRQLVEEQHKKEELRQESALIIQRLYRGYLGRDLYSYLLQEHEFNNAATAIQTAWRSYDAEQTYFFKLDCIIHIQTVMRGALANIWVIDYLGSIIVSQNAVRRWFAIRKAKTLRKLVNVLVTAEQEKFKEHRAAAILQLFYQKEVKGSVINRQATKVQSFFRMVKAMVDLELLKDQKRRKERKERRRARKKQQEADDMSIVSNQQSIYSSQETIATTATDQISIRARPRRYYKREGRRSVSRNRTEMISGSPSLNIIKKNLTLNATENEQRKSIASKIPNSSQTKGLPKARSVNSSEPYKIRSSSPLTRSNNFNIRSDSPLKSQLVPGLFSKTTPEKNTEGSSIPQGVVSKSPFKTQLRPAVVPPRGSSSPRGGRKSSLAAKPTSFVGAPLPTLNPPPNQAPSSRRSRSRCRAEAFNDKSQELLEKTRIHSQKTNQRNPGIITLPSNL